MPIGTYKDCFLLEIKNADDESISSTKYWITEDGVLPQMETNVQDLTGMLVKLEKYYEN